MSSKTQPILDAIEAALDTATATGGTLEDVGSFFVLRTSADTPPEWGAATPMLIVSVLSETGKEIAVPPIATQKDVQVAFTLFTENSGDTTEGEAARIIDLVETEFRQVTFGLASWFDFVSKSYSRTSIAPFSGDWNGQAEYVCQYRYLDMIGC